MHSFYFTNAFQTIITILQNNEDFLLKLLNIQEEVEEESSSPSNNSKILKKIMTEGNLAKSKQISIDHISSKNPQEQIQINEEKKAKFKEEQKTLFSAYTEFYGKIPEKSKQKKPIVLPQKEDFINFYLANCMNSICLRISNPKRLNFLKKNFFTFLSKVSINGNSGISANQELIYKIMITEYKTYDYILIPMEYDESKLILNIDNNKRELYEICQFQKKSKDKEGEMSPKKILNFESSKFIQQSLADQLDFYSHMCNGRNYTWKNHLEKQISSSSLIKYLDLQIDFGKKPNILKLNCY